jgi:phosphate ABC transporter permease protein PstC
MEASAINTRGTAAPLGERPSRARLADPAFRVVLTVLAALVLVLIAFFFVFLADKAEPAFSKFGVFGFVFDNNWDVSKGIYGALPLVVGTVLSSGIALIIGVPVAVATALFVTELCPRRLKSPLTILIELLAAVPSVVYGLWGFLVVIPALKPFQQWLADTFSFLPFVGGPVAGPSYFIAGLILAIMIVPIVSAISREVMATVPTDHKEAALALGATRWEMIRIAVLPYSRRGITGAAMLGLGRAIGETIAVTLVIGNAPQIGKQIFDQGYTLAAVIANEFGEAANNELHTAALIAAGLVLFVLTLVINALARWIVTRAERVDKGKGTSGGMPAGPSVVGATPMPVDNIATVVSES